MWIFCRKTSTPDTPKQRLRTSGDERRLLCVASCRLVFQPQVCTLMHRKADSHLACWLCACVRGNTSPYLEVVVVNWKSPDSRFTNCCLKKLCYFTPVSLTKTLLIKKLSGKKLEVLLAKNQSRKPGETALMGEIMVTTATGSRSILFLFPSLSSCPDSLRWITNQRDCSHWPQQGLTNAVFHCKLEVRISRCVFLTSYS